MGPKMEKAFVEKVANQLKEITAKRDATCLYAVESGSRAWGFASTDSDWDVRFLYSHPIDWYLDIDWLRPKHKDKKLVKRDCIEIPVDENLMDFAGWEIRKALDLLRKSNAPLIEWLRSPLIYMETNKCVNQMREIAESHWSPKAAMFHYLHLAKGNFNQYIKGKPNLRKKKYLYVMRALLCCKWIELNGTFPPMEFDRVLEIGVPYGVDHRIADLLVEKKSGIEMGECPPILELDHYIAGTIAYIDEYAKSAPEGRDMTNELNEILRGVLWGLR